MSYPLSNKEFTRMRTELNSTQLDVLLYLKTTDRSPSIYEVAQGMDLAHSTVRKAMKALTDKGWIGGADE